MICRVRQQKMWIFIHMEVRFFPRNMALGSLLKLRSVRSFNLLQVFQLQHNPTSGKPPSFEHATKKYNFSGPGWHCCNSVTQGITFFPYKHVFVAIVYCKRRRPMSSSTVKLLVKMLLLHSHDILPLNWPRLLDSYSQSISQPESIILDFL